MKIPKYWANKVQVVRQPNEHAYRLSSWQWSDLSLAEAQQRADDRLRALVAKVSAGGELDRYGYGERPLREEIIQPLATRSGSEIAVVTRNVYGALVLNATNTMFIDIDFPEKGAGASLAGSLQRMFGARPPSPQDLAIQRIAAWASQHPDLGIRIYRTFAGLRCLITNQLFDPGQATSSDILRALDSDPLYIRLCQAQGCFRARLTPKPWRCSLDNPPSRYPWENSAAETKYRQWQQEYEQSIGQYSVCQFVKQIGPTEIHPDVEPILTMHDRMTGSASNLGLA